MIQLSAFGDEIAADLDEQLDTLSEIGIRHIDLRAAWGTPVLALDDEQVERIKTTLHRRDVRVAAIGSPIGKAPIDAPFEMQLQQCDRAIALAQRLNAPYIRIFSFYPPARATEPTQPEEYRQVVLDRLGELTARARAADVILTHENEKDIYGDAIDRCVDLLASINDPHFRAVFDPANFIQCKQAPFPEAFQAIRPWLAYMHVKDATAEGAVTVAGEGVSHWTEILRALHAEGYDGIFSLEPHLKAAEQFAGFSGPQLFARAARAFQALLAAEGWHYA